MKFIISFQNWLIKSILRNRYRWTTFLGIIKSQSNLWVKHTNRKEKKGKLVRRGLSQLINKKAGKTFNGINRKYWDMNYDLVKILL